MRSDPIIPWQIEGEKVKAVTDFIFLGSKITVDYNCSHEIKRHLFLGRKAKTNMDSVLKGEIPLCWQRTIQSKLGFFLLVVYRCESWTRKKAGHQRTSAFELWLEKTLESPLDCKEIISIDPKGNQPWMFTERTDAEAEAPVLWPPDAKGLLTGRGLEAGKDWRQEERGVIEN